MLEPKIVHLLEKRFITQDEERVEQFHGKPPGIIKIDDTDKAMDRLVYE